MRRSAYQIYLDRQIKVISSAFTKKNEREKKAKIKNFRKIAKLFHLCGELSDRQANQLENSR